MTFLRHILLRAFPPSRGGLVPGHVRGMTMGFAAFDPRRVSARSTGGGAPPGSGGVRRFVPGGPATVGGARAHAAWVVRLFGRACWALHADGRCLLLPAPGHTRTDVFPIGGVAEGADAQVRVTLERHTGALAVTVTGMIKPESSALNRFTGQYELRAGDVVRRHPVSVPLAELRSADPWPWYSLIENVPVPAVYDCRLTGRAGGSVFGPLRAELSIVDPIAGARDAIEIMLSPYAVDPPGVMMPDALPPEIVPVGEMLWLTSVPGAGHGETGSYRVEARDGTVDVIVDDADDGAVGVSFRAPSRLLGAMPVAARRARLRVVCHRAPDGRPLRVEGQLWASGMLLDEPADYTATLVGEVSEVGAGFGSVGFGVGGEGMRGDGFDRVWTTAGYGRG